MHCPDVPFQHSPLPNAVRVAFATAFTITKQIKHEGRQIENRLVHDVARKTGWRLKDTAKTVEDTRLLDSSLASLMPVLDVVLGGDNII